MDDPNTSLGAVGDDCMYEEDCADGLTCGHYVDENGNDQNACAEMDDPNTSPGAVGDACMYEEDCADGLTC